MEDGDVIDLSQMGNPNLTIRANPVAGQDFGSISFDLRGPLAEARVESLLPFTIFGEDEDSGLSRGNQFSTGEYLLKAIPFSSNKAQGIGGATVQIAFRLISANNQRQQFDVYPVPARSFVHIKKMDKLEGEIEFVIKDLFGNVVLNGHSDQGVTDIEVKRFKKGIYFLEIISLDKKTERTRIIIE